MRVPRGDDGIFGEPTVAFRPEIPRRVQGFAARLPQAGLNEHTLADASARDAFAGPDDGAADVGALNPG